jgi:GntR family transcriptional regulator, rspAB operon transcriptional repressor
VLRSDISETSKDRIYKELRRAIIMGHIQPDERLEIQELTAHHQSSVTPVRDALQMLAQEGLVTIKPRSGYFVAHVTFKELRDLLELRELLELAAVERAAQCIREEQLAELELVHAGYTGDDDLSYDRYTDENRRFHYLVAEASGNAELAAMLGHLHDRLARFMVMRHAGQTQPVSHGHIIDALRAHDVSAAKQAMRAEIDDSRNAILDRVMREEGAFWGIGINK